MPRTAPPSVLIVDDDPRNRKLIETLLRVDGFDVRAADSGAAALAAVAAALPDLVLLDLMMPGMDGFEVVRRLKADPAASGVPIVMVTALDDAASRARLAAAGVERVLVKPVDRWQLKALMAELLGPE
ncbi:MAG TPA: response regulator [Aromatoleum sp.]|uniref:response regulator n=1 Tax=Aromatoleum sp. TaxID=2307007 RepID=UPI002B45F8B4|nr:response regulator [Aromatoleum sp.]HJV24325.1 response regulator [Aromatoleum sp.]